MALLFGDGGEILDKARLELHAKTQTELDKLVLDLVQRLLAEVAVLEHLGLALEGKLSDGSDVCVVEAVRGADREFNLVHAHSEQLLEAVVLLANLDWGLVKLDLCVVEVDEDVEVMTKDRGGLKKCFVRGKASVGPDVEDELVVIGLLADAGLLDGIFDLGDRREDGIDGDDANRLIRALVLVAGSEAAADLHLELGLKLHFLVESADVLVRIENLALGGRLDVTGGDSALLVHGEDQVTNLMVVGLELNLLEVEDDLDDILDDAGDSGELMGSPLDLDRGDGCSLERGEKGAAKRVADGVAVASLKGLGNELRVGFCGGFLVLSEGLRHFEATEADRHDVFCFSLPGFPWRVPMTSTC